MHKNDPRRAPDHKALGKGLHALLPARGNPAPATVVSENAREERQDGYVISVPIAQIHPNPNQPRREFDEQALLELAQSIEREGVIQPVLLRKTAPEAYEIIAGERRWRAASLAGLSEIPVIVREADDHQALELAIVENIQREDLNPIELATAFERMAAELSLSHEEIGQKTGKDRATVTNAIRLLQLPTHVQELITAKKLTPGHARALLKLPTEADQSNVADRCMREGWSVRQIEEFTKPPQQSTDEIVTRQTSAKARQPDPNVRAAIDELQRVLGTRVRIMEKGKGKGVVELEYYSPDDLDRIYSLIVGSTTTDSAML